MKETMSELFPHEPERSGKAEIYLRHPFNAESPLEELGRTFITPNDCFLVRNHLPVPEPWKRNDVKLCINNEKKRKCFTIDEIKTMQSVAKTVTLQCAGNRRSQYE